ncbi:hypothetical protein [Pseudomonas sp. RL]|uniref:hypothetical protein n=1 Tax=Pseudomonas sp. RL TaxID=1452718 RepID=UPI0012DEDF00|nr:hypothetical protein [Pseudomonas sp. RL]
MDENKLLMEAGVALSKLRLLQERPSVRLLPNLRLDGNQWCTYLGDSSEDGVVGYGDTPEAAMLDFDRAWLRWPGTEGLILEENGSVEDDLTRLSDSAAEWACRANAINIYKWLEHRKFHILKSRTITISGGPDFVNYTAVRAGEEVRLELYPGGEFKIFGAYEVVSVLRKEFLECFDV